MGIKNKWTKFTALMVVVCFVFSVSAFAAEPLTDIAVVNHVLDDGEIVTCVASQKVPLLTENVKSDNGQIATLLVYDGETESTQNTVTPRIYDDREVSHNYDIAYVVDGKVISVHSAAVVGVCSNNSSYSQITSVSFTHLAGVTSATNYKISGNTATLSMQPPNYPLAKFLITLSSGGAWSCSRVQ